MITDALKITPIIAFQRYLLLCMVLCLMAPVSADILPQEISENQLLTRTSVIDATGIVAESTSLVWNIGDVGLEKLPWTVLTRDGFRSGSIAYSVYKESITSNGGQISEVKSFSMDTHAKREGLYNIEAEKVLTYTSQNGSHLMGDEQYVLDVAGNWSGKTSDLVCVFSRSDLDLIPAFCNKVTARAQLQSITTAQIESSGSVTVVGSSPAAPAALNYAIAVTPDGDGYAQGIVSTTFTVSVMEGRTPSWREEERWIDDWQWMPGQSDSLASLYPGYSWYRPPLMLGGGVFWYFGVPSPNPPYDWVISLGRSSFGGEEVSVFHNNDRFRTSSSPGSSLTGNLVLTNNVGNPLPPDAQITVDAGDGSGPYTLTYQGTRYIIDPWDPNPASISIIAIPSLQPISTPTLITILEHYDELATTLTAIDTTTVSGSITQFGKVFSYQSGIACENC